MSGPAPKTAAVLGAGVMGSAIAAHLANAGLRVLLLDLPAKEGPPRSHVERLFREAMGSKPPPLFLDAYAERITLGTFEHDFERVAEADWVVEAVIERLDVKRGLMDRVERAAHDRAIVSTNTSGIPIASIAEGRSESFRRRFLGTHFFNPPRYMRLLELIPSQWTNPAVVERMAEFARVGLGKGVVVAKDVPGFVGNRIGVFAFLAAMRPFLEGDYTIEETDALTGPVAGRPKSATFRTADLAGLDTIRHVVEDLHRRVEGDEKDAFRVPDLLVRLVEAGALGEKTKKGFYAKRGGKILSVDPKTLEYREPRSREPKGLDDVRDAGELPERLRALLKDDGRSGAHFRATFLPTLAYAARKAPEIAHSPADVDRAMRWGFGWELGPFEAWDAIGFADVRDAMAKEDVALPPWIDELARQDPASFYRRTSDGHEAWVPHRGWQPDPRPADEITIGDLEADRGAVAWESDDARLVEMGEGVLLFRFRTKANTITRGVIDGLVGAIDRVEAGDARGLVVANEGEHFSMGAHLGEVAMATLKRQWKTLDATIAAFQQATRRVRHATKPLVVAVHGRVLGGGCEIAMACRHPVAAADSFVGLVEVGVGLIPAGGGSARMAARAAARAPGDRPHEVLPHLRRVFETVGRAHVATSAPEAVERGFLDERTTVVMNPARLLHVAKEEVLRLSREGWVPEPPGARVRVLGAGGRAAFDVVVRHLRQGGFVGEHDEEVARRLAWVMTGGDLTVPADVSEEYLLGLEREAFLALLGTGGTQQKIAALLTRGSPKAAQLAAKGLAAISGLLGGRKS
jgi:3-hydroxyacyl-CoA dehydrogenase